MKKFLGLTFIASLFLASCGQQTATSDKKEEKTSFDLQKASTDFKQHKELVDNAKESKKLTQKLRQEIGLKAFDAQEIEISEAELWYEGQNIVRIDARFYKGLPVGTKHWYIKDGNPIGIEVALIEADADGNQSEKAIYQLLRNEADKKWLAADAKGLDEGKLKKANEENEAEWQLLKTLAEKYKPEAK